MLTLQQPYKLPPPSCLPKPQHAYQRMCEHSAQCINLIKSKTDLTQVLQIMKKFENISDREEEEIHKHLKEYIIHIKEMLNFNELVSCIISNIPYTSINASKRVEDLISHILLNTKKEIVEDTVSQIIINNTESAFFKPILKTILENTSIKTEKLLAISEKVINKLDIGQKTKLFEALRALIKSQENLKLFRQILNIVINHYDDKQFKSLIEDITNKTEFEEYFNIAINHYDDKQFKSLIEDITNKTEFEEYLPTITKLLLNNETKLKLFINEILNDSLKWKNIKDTALAIIKLSDNSNKKSISNALKQLFELVTKNKNLNEYFANTIKELAKTEPILFEEIVKIILEIAKKQLSDIDSSDNPDTKLDIANELKNIAKKLSSEEDLRSSSLSQLISSIILSESPSLIKKLPDIISEIALDAPDETVRILEGNESMIDIIIQKILSNFASKKKNVSDQECKKKLNELAKKIASSKKIPVSKILNTLIELPSTEANQFLEIIRNNVKYFSTPPDHLTLLSESLKVAANRKNKIALEIIFSLPICTEDTDYKQNLITLIRKHLNNEEDQLTENNLFLLKFLNDNNILNEEDKDMLFRKTKENLANILVSAIKLKQINEKEDILTIFEAIIPKNLFDEFERILMKKLFADGKRISFKDSDVKIADNDPLSVFFGDLELEKHPLFDLFFEKIKLKSDINTLSNQIEIIKKVFKSINERLETCILDNDAQQFIQMNEQSNIYLFQLINALKTDKEEMEKAINKIVYEIIYDLPEIWLNSLKKNRDTPLQYSSNARLNAAVQRTADSELIIRRVSLIFDFINRKLDTNILDDNLFEILKNCTNSQMQASLQIIIKIAFEESLEKNDKLNLISNHILTVIRDNNSVENPNIDLESLTSTIFNVINIKAGEVLKTSFKDLLLKSPDDYIAHFLKTILDYYRPSFEFEEEDKTILKQFVWEFTIEFAKEQYLESKDNISILLDFLKNDIEIEINETLENQLSILFQYLDNETITSFFSKIVEIIEIIEQPNVNIELENLIHQFIEDNKKIVMLYEIKNKIEKIKNKIENMTNKKEIINDVFDLIREILGSDDIFDENSNENILNQELINDLENLENHKLKLFLTQLINQLLDENTKKTGKKRIQKLIGIFYGEKIECPISLSEIKPNEEFYFMSNHQEQIISKSSLDRWIEERENHSQPITNPLTSTPLTPQDIYLLKCMLIKVITKKETTPTLAVKEKKLVPPTRLEEVKLRCRNILLQLQKYRLKMSQPSREVPPHN